MVDSGDIVLMVKGSYSWEYQTLTIATEDRISLVLYTGGLKMEGLLYTGTPS